LAHLALALFHSFDVHLETSSTVEDVGEEGVSEGVVEGEAVCASAAPEVTTARMAMAADADRMTDMGKGSRLRIPMGTRIFDLEAAVQCRAACGSGHSRDVDQRLIKTDIATNAEPGTGAQRRSGGNEQSSCHAFFMS
jgi:hypothetical protein